MGRAERRRLERNNRIEERKGKILIDREELARIRQAEADRAAAFDVEALLTAFALAERRVHGFGQKRILKSLNYIDEMMSEIISGEKTIDDYRRELEEEVSVRVKY